VAQAERVADLVQQRGVAFAAWNQKCGHRFDVHPDVAGGVAFRARQRGLAFAAGLLGHAESQLAGGAGTFCDFSEREAGDLRGLGQDVAHGLLFGGGKGAKAGLKVLGNEAEGQRCRAAERLRGIPTHRATGGDGVFGQGVWGDEIDQWDGRRPATCCIDEEHLHVDERNTETGPGLVGDRGQPTVRGDADVEFVQTRASPCGRPTVERVDSRAPVEVVLSAVVDEPIGCCVADDSIVVNVAQDVVDSNQRVARAEAVVGPAFSQVGDHANRRVPVRRADRVSWVRGIDDLFDAVVAASA
jgi:hypothetical protein